MRQGASDYTFQYNLDGLLDLDETAVPCYSAAEVVHTSAVVAESILAVPLPPVAKVVALESIVQSRKFWVQQRRSMNARLHEHGVATADTTSAPTQADTSTGGNGVESPPLHGGVGAAPVVRRYGDSTESRIDLVCVRDAVLECGLQECTQDRSAAATTLVSGSEATTATAAATDAPPAAQQQQRHGDAPTVVRDANFAHVPAEVLKAATAAAASTHWSSPGNMSLREAYIEVNRTTLSSRAPWFQSYRCVSRVQCPDCHQALGFVFKASETPATTVADKTAAKAGAAGMDSRDAPSAQTQGLKRPATTQDREGEDGGETAAVVHARTENGDEVQHDSEHNNSNSLRLRTELARPAEVDGGARLPHAKKTKNENDAQAAAAATTRRGFQEAQQLRLRLSSVAGGGNAGAAAAEERHEGLNHASDSSNGADSVDDATARGDTEAGEDNDEDAPLRFIGLELKRVVQRDWDLRAFQERYSKSQTLASFRELFPEAEELQSLYSRLLGLRTQTELYNSLLRRHKEQNDVQMALLNSNKDRMHTYDEKVKTMQQIIEAQRAQIEMQTRQIRNQEELVQSHRRQFATQQRQMDVEQMLLSQQSRTIESQKEQLRLLKNHFRDFQPEVLAELNAPRSPPAPPSLQQPSTATAGKETTRARTAALHQSPSSPEESAEDDWADVNEDDAEIVHIRRQGAQQHEATSSPVSSGCRGTPPAHLCGVPTSFPPVRGVSGKPADASRDPSPLE